MTPVSQSGAESSASHGAGAAPSGSEAGPALVVVLVTAPEESARELVGELLDERLIACANVASISSLYRWEGELRDDPEALLVMKTTTEKLRKLEQRTLELHPYEVPEFLVLPTLGASAAYADWARSETRTP